MLVGFHSDERFWGVGFQAKYQHFDPYALIKREINLTLGDEFLLKSLNFPNPYPAAMCFHLLLRTKYGFQIRLKFQKLFMEPTEIFEEGRLILDDRIGNISLISLPYSYKSRWNRINVEFCSGMEEKEIFKNSALSKIKIFLAAVDVVEDFEFWPNKTITYGQQGDPEGIIEFCTEGLCQNGGQCVNSEFGKPFCECPKAFLGTFCHFSFCDFVQPCDHGVCHVQEDKEFICQCDLGYTGAR